MITEEPIIDLHDTLKLKKPIVSQTPRLKSPNKGFRTIRADELNDDLKRDINILVKENVRKEVLQEFIQVQKKEKKEKKCKITKTDCTAISVLIGIVIFIVMIILV